ncbi:MULTISPECIES: transposase [unclassified Microcoleus]|uniref:transposase n=1 Tax=unclassified Microcoleus TaxID=2642155 RepID=UPI00403F68E8
MSSGIIRDIDLKDLIFIDESGVNLAMVRLYAWSLKGSRAKEEKPNKREKNISLIGSVSVNEQMQLHLRLLLSKVGCTSYRKVLV